MLRRHSILFLLLLTFGMFFAFSNKAEALSYTCVHDDGAGIGCGNDWYCTNAPGSGAAKCLATSLCTGLTPATITIPNCASTDTCGVCATCLDVSTGQGSLCGTYPSTSCVPAYSGSNPIANCSVYTKDCSTTNTCNTCTDSNYSLCDSGNRCQLNRKTSDAPVIANCSSFDQCGVGQPCSGCSGEFALCSSSNSCVSNPAANLCASLVNCTTGQCASCVSGASRCAATNTCIANKTCPSGQTFDPCATGSNFCTGTANSLKIGFDSLRTDSFLFNSSLSLPSLTIPPSGFLGINTTTPSNILSVSGGNIFINDSAITSATPNAAITKTYLDSALSAYSSSNSLWQLSGNNLFASSTSWSVGIGTASPGGLLHLQSTNGNDSPKGDLILSRYWASNSDTRASSIFHYRSSVDNLDKLMFGVSGDGGLNSAPNLLANAKMAITASGYVGIGTTTPSSALDIFSKVHITSGGTIYNTDNARYLDMTGVLTDSLKVSANIYTTAGLFKSDGAGSNYMLGSLGVGTSSPAYKLDVNGQGRFIGNTAANPALALGVGTGGIMSSGTNDVALVSNAINVATFVAASATDVRFQINTTNYSTMFGQYEGNWSGVTNPMIMQPLSPATSHDIAITGVQNSPTSGLVIKSTGLVGIGTVGPDAKLNVNGTFHVTGALNSVTLDKLTGTGNRIVMTDASGSLYATSSSIATGLPSGSAGQTLRSDGTNWLANSIIYNDGTNVGIGTNNPLNKLQISGSVGIQTGYSNGLLNFQGDATTTLISATRSDNSQAGKLLFDGWGSFMFSNKLGIGTTGPLNTGTATLYVNGNVGIGTTTPLNNLEINTHGFGNLSSVAIGAGYDSVTNPGITIYRPSGVGSNIYSWQMKVGDNIAGASDDLYFMSSPAVSRGSETYTPRLTIKSSGFVGIGTTSPSAALDIFSKVKITSGGTVYNTDSTRYLDMTGILTDSLKVSGDIYTTAGEFKSDGAGVNYMLGNLGIGTTSASVKLQISGGANQVINVGGGRIGGLANPQSSDEAVPLSYLSANYLSTSTSIGVSSISLTATTYNGSLTYTGGYTGYDAGNKICNAYSAGSHFCRTDEIIYLIQRNGATGFTAINGSNSWIADGPPGYTGVISADDCGGWTDNTANKLGHFWMFNSTGGGRGSLSSCDTMKNVACCK